MIRKIEDHQPQGNSTDHRVDNLFFFTLVNLGIAPARTTLFKDTYGLTNAEAKVVVLLSSGLQIPEIAAKRGAKIQTIRSQIKVIKAKTHSRDVPSIIRLLCGFSAGLLTTTPLTNNQTQSDQTAAITHHQFTLRDGRKLAYLDQGDPTGTPIFLLHTIGYGGELLEAAAQAAKRMKLRFIAPYRPGYGKSETHKGVTGEKHLNMACTDMVELMDKLNLSKISILGLAMGSIIATRFTHLYPQKVDHLFAISHAPMWREQWAESMPKKQRLLLNAVKIAPSLSALVLRATIAYIYRGNVHDLFKTSCGDSAADLHARDQQFTTKRFLQERDTRLSSQSNRNSNRPNRS